ncbi:hypothetical protein TrLO_g11636 [Triparma laevis f. longispina]|uniref:Uncharacterized protein n=1 Tax=Triparma laevis f. longispina TaxID=1714387 RepID=A0A9W7CG58_9STRA|nr:hypothetical protein TrLO_g11636 [Triparma laevis f. longispina]
MGLGRSIGAREEKMKRVKRVIFFLNITKVGKEACKYANLIAVDIPEGMKSISAWYIFSLGCYELPSNIEDYDTDVVVAHLRSQQNSP